MILSCEHLPVSLAGTLCLPEGGQTHVGVVQSRAPSLRGALAYFAAEGRPVVVVEAGPNTTHALYPGAVFDNQELIDKQAQDEKTEQGELEQAQQAPVTDVLCLSEFSGACDEQHLVPLAPGTFPLTPGVVLSSTGFAPL